MVNLGTDFDGTLSWKGIFHNKKEPDKPLKFHRSQMAFLSAIALAGWVRGFFLLAAIGELIKKWLFRFECVAQCERCVALESSPLPL